MAETVYFGKHKGKSVTEVPDDYIWWMLNQKKPNKIFIEEWVSRYGLDALPDNKATRRYKQILKNPLTWMADIEGEHYEWARSEWEDAGGDASQCPFATDWVGPELRWEDGQPVIFCPVIP